MKVTDLLKGAIIASAAAGLFGCASQQKSSSMPEATSAETVQCAGINQCAGHGQCGAADGSHDCAGKNACKGKGWVKVSAEECSDKGGTPM